MLEKQNNGGLKYLGENLFWENERLNTSMYSKAKKKKSIKMGDSSEIKIKSEG